MKVSNNDLSTYFNSLKRNELIGHLYLNGLYKLEMDDIDKYNNANSRNFSLNKLKFLLCLSILYTISFL